MPSTSAAATQALEPAAASGDSLCCSPPQPASCSESDAPPPYSLSQRTADALWVAVEAKEALEVVKERYQQALLALDELVEAGALPEKHLPIVNGFTVYRQEGRLSWAYPDSIKVLENEVKKRKQLAEQLGEATPKRGKPFWTIKPAEPLSL